MREPKPPQFKSYPDARVVPLPRALPKGPSTVDALDGSAPRAGEFDVARLAAALFLTAGVVRYREYPGGAQWFRAAGSSGNLSPLEVYVVTGGLRGLPPGVYHYAALAHGLVRLRTGDHRSRVAAALAVPRSWVGAAAIIITGIPWRAGWKYEERSFRNLYRDAGTMLAQLLAVSEIHHAELFTGFVDTEIAELLDLPYPHEFPLAVVSVSTRSDSVPDAPPLATTATGFLSDTLKVFPLVVAAQAAGAHADPHAVRAWRSAASRSIRRQASAVATVPSDEDLATTIRRRGSARRFQRGSGTDALLRWALPLATQTQADFLARGASLLEHHLLLHDVDGYTPGVYRLVDGTLQRTRAANCRDEATRLCLDQSLAGSGVLAAFHTTPLASVISQLGERGYRAALLEAGMVSGRLHLAAALIGLGASGLTFYDDEVRRFIGTDTDPLLVTAVGQLAYRALPGGEPGRPTLLRPAKTT